MSENVKLTLAQAHNILVQIAAHPSLQLNLADHTAVQQALQVLKPEAELTLAPQPSTV